MALGRIGEFPPGAIFVIEAPFATLGFAVTLLLRGVFVRLRIGEGSTARTIVWVLALSYLAGMIWTASFHTYLHNVAVPWTVHTYPGEPLPIRRGPLLDNTVYNTLTILAWSTIYVGLVYRDLLQAQRNAALRALAEARDAQLRMLAYQLNPHFLFNTLNSICAMIDEDRGRVRTMVTELARFLRYALIDRPLHLAPLYEEVRAVEGYLAIEKIRFEDRLDAQVEVPADAARCLVPAFLLNPLVENALTHGVAASGQPLRVRVSAVLTPNGRLRIDVENSGSFRARADVSASPHDERTSADTIPTSGGVGLSNVRARLAHQYSDNHSVTVTELSGTVRVTIDIPATGASREAAEGTPPHADAEPGVPKR